MKPLIMRSKGKLVRRGIAFLVSVVISGLSLGVASSPASAAQPKSRLIFPEAHVGAGDPVQARFVTKRVPKGGRVLLEKAVGTAGVWRKVQRLPNRAGASTTLTAPPMGRHAYRVAILDATRKVVAVGRATLFSYGPVELGTINGDSTGTVTLANGTIYRYVWSVSAGSVQREIIKIDRASCRSLAMSTAFDQQSQFATNVLPATVTVVQEAAEPTGVAVAPNAASSTTVTLVPGTAWALQVTVPKSGGSIFSGAAVYGNGVAQCYTPTGRI